MPWLPPPSGLGKPLRDRFRAAVQASATTAPSTVTPRGSARAILKIDCGCKPANTILYDGDRFSLSAAQSCIHIAGTILQAMASAGWSEQDARQVAEDSPALEILHSDPILFRKLWAGSRPERGYKPPGVEPPTGPRLAPTFKIQPQLMISILAIIEANPDFGLRQLRAAIPHKHGVVDTYLHAAISSGYLEVTHGARNKNQYRVLGRPQIPKRRKPKRPPSLVQGN